jgi:hypothetical protein
MAGGTGGVRMVVRVRVVLRVVVMMMRLFSHGGASMCVLCYNMPWATRLRKVGWVRSISPRVIPAKAGTHGRD